MDKMDEQQQGTEKATGRKLKRGKSATTEDVLFDPEYPAEQRAKDAKEKGAKNTREFYDRRPGYTYEHTKAWMQRNPTYMRDYQRKRAKEDPDYYKKVVEKRKAKDPDYYKNVYAHRKATGTATYPKKPKPGAPKPSAVVEEGDSNVSAGQ